MGRPVSSQVGGDRERGEHTVDIHLSIYTIFNEHNRGINYNPGKIEQTNMDLGVLFKTKITGGVYTR